MNTWIVIKIGNREYAVNSKFVVAVTELKHNELILESQKQFVRGIYNIFNADIPVVDGYKITREEPKNETKLNFSKRMTDIKLKFMSFMDAVGLNLIYKDESKDEINELIKDVTKLIESDSLIFNNEYLNKLANRLKNNISININRISILIDKNRNGEINELDKDKEFKSIESSVNRQIYDVIDNVIECYNSNISEMCIVFKASGYHFGLSIDSIEIINDTKNEATHTQRTILSNGTIEINKRIYNVLNLTKVGKITD